MNIRGAKHTSLNYSEYYSEFNKNPKKEDLKNDTYRNRRPGSFIWY